MSVGLACLLVLGACSDGSDPEQVVLPSPTASAEAPADDPTPSPTASAEAPDGPGDEIDVTTVPDNITPEYIEAAFAAIESGAAPATQAVLAAPPNGIGAIPTGTRGILEDMYTGTILDVAVARLEQLATSEEARVGLRSPDEFTGERIQVRRIVQASPRCIVAVAAVDEGGVRIDGGIDPVLVAVSFSPRPESGMDQPAWLLRDQLLNTSPEGNPNPDETMLDAEIADLFSVLDHTCEGSS